MNSSTAILGAYFFLTFVIKLVGSSLSIKCYMVKSPFGI